MNRKMTENPQSQQLDRADTRVRRDEGLAGAFSAFLDRVRSGDLGMLPVVIGLIVISVVFSALNPVFLAPNNLANLLFDASAVGLISLGVVLVLLLGEIDLSIGSMSGLSSAVIGVLWVKYGVPLPLAILAAVAGGAAVGLVYSFLRNRFEMPSFVATLAGLLALLGMQLYILGPTGSINLPFTSPLVQFGQLMIMPTWLSYGLSVLAGIVVVVGGIRTMQRRSGSNLSSSALSVVIIKAVVLTAALVFAVFYLGKGRGVPWMFVVFVFFVVVMDYALTRTKWGRSMLAVGGNAEAARRSGINVSLIRMSAFALCSAFAALGGLFSAARLASASIQAGTGDVNLNAIAAGVIGGTSLFGGRGSAWSALLGIIVIQSISNGLTLLNLSSSLRYMITGGVLAIAVIVDLSPGAPAPAMGVHKEKANMSDKLAGKTAAITGAASGDRTRMCALHAERRRQGGSHRPRCGAPGRAQPGAWRERPSPHRRPARRSSRPPPSPPGSKHWSDRSTSSMPMPAPMSAETFSVATPTPGTGC